MQKIKSFFKIYDIEIFITATVFVLFFLLLAKVPIFDGDTFFYIAKAKKMALTGDWFNTSSVMAKPLLGIWVMAFFYKLLGVSLFTTYLPHSLFAAGTLLIMFLFLKEFFGQSVARLGSLILLTSAMFFYQSCSPMLDIPMLFFITAAHFAIFKYLKNKDNKSLFLAAIFCGLGFLTKGLLGAVLPAITFFLYLVINRINPFKEFPSFIKNMLVASLLFLAVASIWLLPQIITNGQEFIQQLYRENIVRFFKPIDETGGYRQVSSGVQRDPHVNILYLFLSFLPWSPFILPLLIAFLKKNYFSDKKTLGFFMSWFLFFLLITTVSGHYKGPRYLLPLLPPLTILLALYLDNLINTKKFICQKLTSRTYLGFFIFLLLSVIGIFLADFQHGENVYKPFVLTFLSLYALVHFAGYYLFKKGALKQGVKAIIIITLTAHLLFLAQGSFYIKQILPEISVASYLKEKLTDNNENNVYAWQIKIRSFELYLGRTVNHISSAPELNLIKSNDLVILKKKDQDLLAQKGERLYENKELLVIKVL